MDTKATFNIPLADVDPQKLSVVELKAGQQQVPNGGFILHVVMFEGKKTYQTVEALRRWPA